MMDNQPITDPVPPPVPVEPVGQRWRIWIIATIAILVGIGALVAVRSLLQRPEPEISQVPQTPTPTPTPIRVLSTIATQSAFRALQQTQASLSAGLSATNLDDPSLTPPVLDLPLGFRQ